MLRAQDEAKSAEAPGQEPGQVGLDWGTYLATLIEERGTLAALAEQLAAARGYVDSVESVERGLRRLRRRGQRDGGVWGRRALQTFGVPGPIEARVRWMGHYHSRFMDLPASVCAELLAIWDRPPLSESFARVWVQLGLASLALRRRQREQARLHLRQAALAAPHSGPAAQVELHLVLAFLEHFEAPEESQAHLSKAEQLLEQRALQPEHHACMTARLIDQRAYPLNKPRAGPADHEGALALYQKIPGDGPPFARCRRENGLGWSTLKLGRRAQAIQHARISVEQAGDSGSLRLRAMALNLLAAALDDEEGRRAGLRAAQIAKRLEDEALFARFSRHTHDD